MSAAVFCPWAFYTPVEAVKRAFTLGWLLGKTTSNKEELLKTLYEASAEDIMEKTNQINPVRNVHLNNVQLFIIL